MTRFSKWAAAAAVGGVGINVTGCGSSAPTDANPGQPGTGDVPADIGGPLYAGAPAPAAPATVPTGEPVVIPNAVVSNDQRVQLAALVDGAVELVATPVDPAAVKLGDPDIVYHPRDTEKKQPYRRIRQDDLVAKDQVLARLDEQLVDVQRQSALGLIQACKEAIKAAQLAEDKQDQLLAMRRTVPGIMPAEILEQESLAARYRENRITSQKELAKAEGEFRSADTQIRRYFVSSPFNGRVVRVLKSPGEYVRSGDVIFELQSTDRVKVEGKLDVAYASLVKRGMRVVVEPTRPIAPNSLVNHHRQEVTSVAVTGHPGRPLVVSGGLDAAALVWDVTGTKASHRLPHPAGTGVRSVAATGPLAKTQMVATGTDDGYIRLWDVSNPDKLPKEEAAKLAERHAGAVVACAFSPDGRFLATASGRDLALWRVADRQRLYLLPSDHRDPVTAVRFTPQGTLVTVARDKSIRVWKLGDKGGYADKIIDHRGGAVDVLGVSSDGGRVLFDKDPGRLDIVNLADERTVGTLQNPGGAARFATLAVFSADDKAVLTVGSDADQRGELTVWEAPQPGGRAAELRRLSTPRNAAVTSAAFSPDPAKRFVVVGTADGGVYFWTQVATDDAGRRIIGEVVSVAPADAKTVAVRVEMTNPADRNGDSLQDRSQATIIVPPEGVVLPAPPAPLAAPPAGPNVAVPAPGAVVPAGGGVPAGGVKPVSYTEKVSPPAAAPTAVVPPVAVPPVTLPPDLPKQ